VSAQAVGGGGRFDHNLSMRTIAADARIRVHIAADSSTDRARCNGLQHDLGGLP
jgi:hypothetical protein